MPAFYGNEQVRRVREAVDLVQLVSEYTAVRKSGANFTCCCLFHAERTPSMYIYPADHSYHCFGCQAHGDAIDLLMQRDRLTFSEAVEALAKRAGIVLVPQNGSGEDGRERQVQQRRLKAFAYAVKHYEELLWGEAGQPALAYLRGRGLRDETLREFGLGWAPGRGSLVRAARERHADPEIFVELNLAKRSEDGHLFDVFRERITFPIHDRSGNPIAISARLLPENEARAKAEGRSPGGKYINSTDTPLYHKGATVYNLHRALKQVHERKRLIVMEGPTDVMAAWQAGERACTAVLGTALTPEHAQVLGRASSGASLIVLFDGDRAGQANSIKAAKTFLASGFPALIAVLPDELDPGELLAEGVGGPDGLKRFEEVLAGAKPELTHLLHTLAPVPHRMPRQEMLAAVRDLAQAIAAIPDATARALARREADTYLGVDLESVALPKTAQAKVAAAADAAVSETKSGPPPPAIDALLHLLVVHPELRPLAADRHGIEPSLLEAPWNAVLATMLAQPDLAAGALRDLAPDDAVRTRLAWYQAHGLLARRPPIEQPVEALESLARTLHRESVQRQLDQLNAESNHTAQIGDHARAAALAREAVELARRINRATDTRAQ